MTEADWLTCTTRPAKMLGSIPHVRRVLDRRASARKFQLLNCACCRLIQAHLTKAEIAMVATIERGVDNGMTDSEFIATGRAISEEFAEAVGGDDPDTLEFARTAVVYCLQSLDFPVTAQRCIEWTLTTTSRAAPAGQKQTALIATRRRICDLIREMIGNPFRPWATVPAWLGGGVVQPDGQTVRLTDTVRRLAHGIHAEQAFDRLPILADALEEAGITDTELLAHCRAATEHVRGCWALDVVRGKG